jgi:hypothetical protein
MTLFKNPMILMSVFALVATLGIPKLLENSTSIPFPLFTISVLT